MTILRSSKKELQTLPVHALRAASAMVYTSNLSPIIEELIDEERKQHKEQEKLQRQQKKLQKRQEKLEMKLIEDHWKLLINSIERLIHSFERLSRIAIKRGEGHAIYDDKAFQAIILINLCMQSSLNGEAIHQAFLNFQNNIGSVNNVEVLKNVMVLAKYYHANMKNRFGYEKSIEIYETCEAAAVKDADEQDEAVSVNECLFNGTPVDRTRVDIVIPIAIETTHPITENLLQAIQSLATRLNNDGSDFLNWWQQTSMDKKANKIRIAINSLNLAELQSQHTDLELFSIFKKIMAGDNADYQAPLYAGIVELCGIIKQRRNKWDCSRPVSKSAQLFSNFLNEHEASKSDFFALSINR